MHTIWKGSISFGLVNIPVKLFTATEDKDVKTRYIHKECGTPINYEKRCHVCNRVVNDDEIVRGFEYEPGKFVLLEKDELIEIAGTKEKTIDIIDFVRLEEIDPIFFDKSYFIGPNDTGEKPYVLLKKAMEDSGKIALAKITIRSKERLAAVRVYKKGLLLETIYYPDEVRSIEHVPGIPNKIKPDSKELKMATQLIDQLTTSFEPEKYKDNYRTAVMDLIENKINKEEIKVAKRADDENVIDLMKALQASIEQAKPEKQKVSPRKKKKVTG